MIIFARLAIVFKFMSKTLSQILKLIFTAEISFPNTNGKKAFNESKSFEPKISLKKIKISLTFFFDISLIKLNNLSVVLLIKIAFFSSNKEPEKIKLKKLHEVIHKLKLKTLDKEEIIFEDFTELSNRVDTLLDIVIHDTKPKDDGLYLEN